MGYAVSAQHIIPKPTELIQTDERFVINHQTTIYADDNTDEIINTAINEIRRVVKNSTLITIKRSPVKSDNQIALVHDDGFDKEAYALTVGNNRVTIKASGAAGLFYGAQTFLQLLPVDIYSSSYQPFMKPEIKGVKIVDKPRFKYRGAHLDVGRHFFSTDFVKKMIDVYAMYKINTFHWHLTEDQGWRIEIKKYPKLTEVGSIRKETMIGHYPNNVKYDGIPYGGYYTQEEIKDVVAYAQKKNITIIPEIEMPGHSMAALTAYPELGCTGGPYELRTTWGVEDHIYCPTENTFKFLEDVLIEVMDLFPSEYIHIGGDEAPKVTWKNSAFVQNLMKEKGFKNEDEVQSYFITRIDEFVTSKGRKIVGWDEILEGGLSPNATVMSWRGEEGGIAAAKMKHDVIMTPNSYVYLDYYQGFPETEPKGIGGFLPLERVYSYEPHTPKLNQDELKYIIGVQGNLWTEYIRTEEHVEYMYFPRLLAVAEIGWSPVGKDYPDFVKRVYDHDRILSNIGVNISNSYLNVTFETGKNSIGQTVVSLNNDVGKGHIRYSLDGSNVNENSLLYDADKKIVVNQNTTIRAALFSEDGKKMSKTTDKTFEISKSTGLPYHLTKPSDKQREMDKFILTDGQKGETNGQELWSGFRAKDFEMTLDLGNKISISSVQMGFLGDWGSWIQTPSEVEVWASNDGEKFKLLKKSSLGKMTNFSPHAVQVNLKFKKTGARYIRVKAKNQGLLPEPHPSAGNASWVFVDEVSVY